MISGEGYGGGETRFRRGEEYRGGEMGFSGGEGYIGVVDERHIEVERYNSIGERGQG